MKNMQTVSLNLTPLFPSLNKPKQEAWRIHKAHEKKTASILLPSSKLSCGYVSTLSFSSCLAPKKKNKPRKNLFSSPRRTEELENHWWPSSDPEHLQSATVELLRLRTMHTVVPALLSTPSTQAKYKARHCLDNSSYLNFLKSPGLGFSKVHKQSSPGVLEGVLSIF